MSTPSRAHVPTPTAWPRRTGRLQLVSPSVADLDFLAEVPPLRRLSIDGLAEISTRVTRRRYPKGAVIVRQGDASTGMYIVESGIVNHTALSPDGREVHVALNHAPEAFGLVSLIDNHPERASAVVLEPCQLLVLRAEDFRFLLHRDPNLSLGVLEVFTAWLRRNHAAQQEAVTLPPLPRVARALVDLVTSKDHQTLDVTQDELAVIVGIARETVNRCLRAFEHDGLIQCGRCSVTILDLEGLRRAVAPRAA